MANANVPNRSTPLKPSTFEDEAPTRPTPHVSRFALGQFIAIERRARAAIERLEAAADQDAVLEVLGDLSRIVDACVEATR
jgi:hypothetical protein